MISRDPGDLNWRRNAVVEKLPRLLERRPERARRARSDNAVLLLEREAFDRQPQSKEVRVIVA
jgi:hypothetical protein